MTVPSTVEGRFGRSLKYLLFRWKGSIMKLVWPDLVVFLILYFLISLLYRYGLDSEQQRSFEALSIYCEKQVSLIPLAFVLGFYVSLVIGRWWAQYKVGIVQKYINFQRNDVIHVDVGTLE
jgi:predicted membrane chloride channel (bestrophin family)